jgi:hypothetical protein
MAYTPPDERIVLQELNQLKKSLSDIAGSVSQVSGYVKGNIPSAPKTASITGFQDPAAAGKNKLNDPERLAAFKHCDELLARPAKLVQQALSAEPKAAINANRFMNKIG